MYADPPVCLPIRTYVQTIPQHKMTNMARTDPQIRLSEAKLSKESFAEVQKFIAPQNNTKKYPQTCRISINLINPQDAENANKTIFLCKYLASESLRIEVNEGLNVVERLNSVMDFIFYGKLGQIATNNIEDQELSVLCLHLLQVCMVYINTLIIQ